MNESSVIEIVVQDIDLQNIRTDGDTQPRVRLDLFTVEKYANKIASGATFPPIALYFDGREYWLADGFHQLEAARLLGSPAISAAVYSGTRRDAMLYAAGANARYGLRRRTDDKRRAVVMLLTDAEWWQWSDSEIARRCVVSEPFVSSIRALLSPPSSDTILNSLEGSEAALSCNYYKMPSR